MLYIGEQTELVSRLYSHNSNFVNGKNISLKNKVKWMDNEKFSFR